LSKKSHGLSVDQNDVLQIDRDRTRFLLDRVAECIQVLFCNPTAYAQCHIVVAADNSVDSACHFEASHEAVALLLICAFPTGRYGGAPCIMQAFSHS
jgi:hypothetical protein